MELVDIYNSRRELCGYTKERHEDFLSDEFKLVVHCCIINNDGDMLIQRRSTHKDSFSGLWDVSCGGCSMSGETSSEAISRELYEELGVKFDFSLIAPSVIISFNSGFDDVYIINENVILEDVVMQEDEVIDVRYANINEIFKLIDSGEFSPVKKSLIQLFFDLSRVNGVFEVKR